MNSRFDLTVIGGGPGGYVAAIRASQLGLKVALIEEKHLGGVCLNWGCIPTKSLLHSAEVYHTVKSSAEYGVFSENAYYDYSKIASKKDAVIKQLRSGIEFLVKSNGIIYINGRAYIKDKNTVKISGKEEMTISTDKIIIATGSRSAKPAIQGINSERVLNSDDIMALITCPESIIIIGGGVIGVELATLFNALDKEVTIIEMTDFLVPGVDIEISSLLRKSLEKKGVEIYTGTAVTEIKSSDHVECMFKTGETEQKAVSDIIVSATGRKPNIENIGLEDLGIVLEKGFIKVNERLETSVRGIYAIGDVTGKFMLAHVASEQGLVSAANAAGKNERSIDYSIIPACIYTNPEIAAVGITESEALKRGYKIKAGRFPVSANGKSILMGEREGLAKIIINESTEEVLGAHIMGPRSTEMIAEICVAMKLETTIDEICDTIHPHPTVSEIIMEAAFDVKDACIHKPKK